MAPKLKKLVLATSIAAGALAATQSAQASIIDHPFFRVLGVVIVWGTDTATGTQPIASDFVLMNSGTGAAGNDIIAADGRAVITGTLNGAPAAGSDGSLMGVINQTSGGVFADNGTTGFLDAADTLSAFGLDATTDVQLDTNGVKHSFYVASNTAFDIYAQASNLNATGDFSTLGLANIDYSLSITTSGNDGLAFGGNAQDPSTGGTGVVAAVNKLSLMSAATKVFDGGRKTAASVGAIAGQSVRFDATYKLNDGSGGSYDLSMGAGLIEADVTYTVYVP